MGEGAESVPGYDCWYDEGAELLKSLDAGFHTQVTGEKIEIKQMGRKHLQHAIQYGKRSIKDYSESKEYWEYALPLFVDELQRRLDNKA